MAPLREFDLAVKAPKGAPPSLPATGAPTLSESGSTALPPSPPLPATASGEAAAAAATTNQAGVASGAAGGAPGAAGERSGGGGGGGSGDGGGGSGESAGEERPGLVSLKGASFRWASGVEEDEHAKIFRGLVELDEKKRKVKGYDEMRRLGRVCVLLCELLF